MRSLLSCIAVALAAAVAPAASPDPLRYVPKEATLVLKVEKPRAVVESVTALDAYRDYETLPQVREALESTTAKRFFQVLKLAETKLGQKWPAMLDSLAGGGMALGTVVGGENAPVLLVVQGADEKKSAEAFKLIVELIAEEFARLTPPGTPFKPDLVTMKGVEVLKLGDDALIARHEATLLFSNKKAAMEKALALVAGEKGAESVLANPNVPAAKKLLGGEPLAWLWFDLKKAKEDKAVSDFLETARTQAFLLFVIGSTVDAVRRADFVAVGLHETAVGFKLSVQLPARRADLPEVMALHAPLKGETHGSLPLLEPPGVLASQSLYLDVGSFWKNRKSALGTQELKDLEQAEKDISKLLPNTTLGELLEMSGVHHRVVLVERGQNQYKTVPDFPLPEMALVSSMRDPKFGKKITATLRTAAALLSLQLGLTMKEEKFDDIDIVTYRFPEGKVLESDPTNIRYNFVPSFAVVGESLIVASSPKLLKDLIPEVKKPIDPKLCSPAVWRAKGYGAGAASGVKARPEASITDSVLGQGVGLDDAKKQLDQYATLLAKLGTVSVTVEHGEAAFKFEVDWQLKK
jgi:hypothetical protein